MTKIRRSHLNPLSILNLGRKLLALLERIHRAGYIHNDLSLDKIVLAYDQKVAPLPEDSKDDLFAGVELHIVDFTFMTAYVDFRNGRHLKKEKVPTIHNVTNDFQSLNRLNSVRTSRKDDLEMLCNILVYLRNGNRLPDLAFPPATNDDSEKRLYFLQAYKESYTLDKLCKQSRTYDHGLHVFCKEVDRLAFTSAPNYAKLH